MAISACASGQNRELLGEYVLGIIGQDRNDRIYQVVHEGAKAAVRELIKKYSIDIDLLELTPDKIRGETQTSSLAELFIKDAEGLIISPENNDSVRASVDFVFRQGCEVVYFETQFSEPVPLTAIPADEVEAGRLAGKEILRRLPSRGRVAILTEKEPKPKFVQRLKGLREVLGYRRIQSIVRCAPNYNSAIEVIHKTEDSDLKNQIKGWVFLGNWPLTGPLQLPWDPERKPLVAIGSTPSAFVYFEQEYLDALIVHPYYEWGYRSIEAMVERLHNGRHPDEAVIKTIPRVVDLQNVQKHREDWLKWLK